jgi:hypothetical protein
VGFDIPASEWTLLLPLWGFAALGRAKELDP